MGYLQSRNQVDTGTPSAVELAFSSNVADDSLIVVGIVIHGSTFGSSINASTVEDSQSNTYTAVGTLIPFDSNGAGLELYYGYSSSAGALTVTATFDYGGVYDANTAIVIHEYENMALSSIIDVQDQNYGGGGSENAGPITTTVAQDILFAILGNSSWGSTVSITPDGDYTQTQEHENGDSGACFNTQYRDVSSTLTDTANWTLGSPWAWAGWIVAFKEDVTPTLVINGSTHAHAADNLVLSQVHQLNIQSASHAHAADNVTLTPGTTGVDLVIQSASHAHTAEELGLWEDVKFVQAASNGSTGSAATTITFGATPAENDYMVAVVAVESNSDLVNSVPSGWSKLDGTALATRSHYQSIYVKRAGASEPTGHQWGFSSSIENVIVGICFRNVDLGSGYGAHTQQVNNSSTADNTAPSIAIGTREMVLHLGSCMYGTTRTPPGSYTEPTNGDYRSGTANNNISAGISYLLYTSGSTTGTQVATQANADYNIGTHVALKPLVKITLQIASTAHAHAAESPTLTEQTPATDLVIQSSDHAHTAESFALTQVHNLAIQQAAHEHEADNVVLTQVHTLAIQDSLHGHAPDNVILTQTHILAIQPADHAHAADNLVLTQIHNLTIQESLHGHTAESFALSQVHNLAIQDSLHAHTAESPAVNEATNLVIQESTHGHTADNLALTQVHVLSIQESLHAHAGDNLLLSQVHVLSIQESLHTHAADNITLAGPGVLDIQSSSHGHTAESITLVQTHILIVQESSHAHAADSLALSQVHVLTVQDSAHAHAADSLTLTQVHNLVIQDSWHEHLADKAQVYIPSATLTIDETYHQHHADNLVLVQSITLTIQSSTHAHAAESLALTQAHNLAIAGALHAHTVDSLILSVISTLVIQDSSHAHTAESLLLAVMHNLAIQDSTHAHTADSFGLTQVHNLIIAGALHAHLADNVLVSAAWLIISASSDRTYLIPHEHRVYQIEYEDRTIHVEHEHRVYVINRE